MAKGFGHIRRRHLVDEFQDRDSFTQIWRYQIPIGASLADVSLEKGDLLPEDVSFQILQSEKHIDEDAGGAFAIVVAVNFYGFNGGAGSLKLNVTTKSGAYTPVASNDVILCGPSNETFTVDLPNPSGVFSGCVFYIKNIGTGIITIDADTTGGTTLDGETTQTLSQWEAIDAVSSGSAWFII